MLDELGLGDTVVVAFVALEVDGNDGAPVLFCEGEGDGEGERDVVLDIRTTNLCT